MNCKECLRLLERYFDHELADSMAERLANHLAVCDICNKAYRQLKLEQELFLLGEVEVDASPEFWPGVFSKAAAARSEAPAGIWRSIGKLFVEMRCKLGAIRLGPLPAAAIVLLTIGGTAGVMKYLTWRENSMLQRSNSSQLAAVALSTPAVSASTPTSPVRLNGVEQETVAASKRSLDRSVVASGILDASGRHRNRGPSQREERPEDLIREAEQKYIAAIALLSRDAHRRRSQLDPEAIAQFDHTLAAIDRAIAGTRRAVRGRPDDPVTAQYMLAAYAKKVDLLRQIVSGD